MHQNDSRFKTSTDNSCYHTALNTTRRMCLRINAFALSGRGDSTMRKTQGVAALALGYVLHWAFSPSLLNPKIE